MLVDVFKSTVPESAHLTDGDTVDSVGIAVSVKKHGVTIHSDEAYVAGTHGLCGGGAVECDGSTGETDTTEGMPGKVPGATGGHTIGDVEATDVTCSTVLGPTPMMLSLLVSMVGVSVSACRSK